MKELHVDRVAETVSRLCREANNHLPPDVLQALERAQAKEESKAGKRIISLILENAKAAADEEEPLCQDTGTTVVFLEVGQDVHVVGGALSEAINAGVRRGYQEGFLRKSIAAHPFTKRLNTRDNTPSIIHAEIVPGDQLKIGVLTKGGGAENMSRMAMLKPSDGREGIVNFVLETVSRAGGNACPPSIIGLGIGGTYDYVAYLAKKAITRPLGQPSPDPDNATLERDLLEKVNDLGIGPLGFGGRVTALAVHVESYPCHIASLPVAVNIQCHSARYKKAVL
ncbi:MAG: fumarate hydratase [Chloroflexi bacterium]|nr:fumarate hydratase [Chloroflexota bacterium]